RHTDLIRKQDLVSFQERISELERTNSRLLDSEENVSHLAVVGGKDYGTPVSVTKPEHRGGRSREPNVNPSSENNVKGFRPTLVAQRGVDFWLFFLEINLPPNEQDRVFQVSQTNIGIEEYEPSVFGPLRDLRTPISIITPTLPENPNILLLEKSPV